MANTISTTGTFTVNIDGINYNGSLSNTITTSGSNAIGNIINIASGSWQGLPTSSLSDIRYVHAENKGDEKVLIATDSAGTKLVAILTSGDVALIPWSGSGQFYANVQSTNASGSLLAVTIGEA